MVIGDVYMSYEEMILFDKKELIKAWNEAENLLPIEEDRTRMEYIGTVTNKAEETTFYRSGNNRYLKKTKRRW